VAQEAQVAKEAQEVKSKAEEILQATRNTIWLKMELEQAKVRALQEEKILSLLSMTPWSKP
jgi:predicted CoA-binding protein